MLPFNKYITGEAGEVARTELDRLTARYEWFTTARRARTLLYGSPDPRLTLPLTFFPTVVPGDNRPETTSGDSQSVSPEDAIIDRFLGQASYRIVPDDAVGEAENVPMPETFGVDGEELITEELAEIYRAQGMYAESREIYRRLSLLNPEKSIYFADIIARIDEEITNN